MDPDPEGPKTSGSRSPTLFQEHCSRFLRFYRKGLLAVVGLGLSATLELLDFPPILWTFDRKGAQLVHAGYENKKVKKSYSIVG
jgi:hypothetical protein